MKTTATETETATDTGTEDTPRTPATALPPARARAAAVVAEVAERLADPVRVAEAATAPGNVDLHPLLPSAQSPWQQLALGEGHPGVALLYAELSRRRPALRSAAHAHLAAGARALAATGGGCLYGGAPALSFAARLGRHAPGDYARLLDGPDGLDAQVAARLRERLAEEAERLDAARAGTRTGAYDAIAGAAGLVRALLLDPGRHHALLRDALVYFTRLTRPVEAHGHRVPGWWVPGAPGAGTDARFTRGHLNLGLAHGICGPLAALALCWEADLRVPGQEEAMSRIVEHVLAYELAEGMWPGAVGFDDLVSGNRTPAVDDDMVAWCYGTPGVAGALYAAGRALGRADWRETAVRVLGEALGRAGLNTSDGSLCHGWAGLLHIAGRMARDSADPRLAALLPRLAEPLLDAYDPALPFCFRYVRPALPEGRRLAPHRAGFLEGASGIALALDAYATGAPPQVPWDAALLVA